MAAEEGQVIGVHSVEAWTEHMHNGNESKKLIVVDFTASWCGPCNLIAPILEEHAKKRPDVTFLKTVAEEWGIKALPTFMFFKEGKLVHKFVGPKS